MSSQTKNNRDKALVAKYWTAAMLVDLGFKVEISSKANLLTLAKGKCILTVRAKGCYDKLGVPFNGFETKDSDFVILVDLRQGALRAQAWIVPTRTLHTELERAYEAMDSVHLSHRTFYWEDGRKPHQGYERKLRPYRNAWKLFHHAEPIEAAMSFAMA